LFATGALLRVIAVNSACYRARRSSMIVSPSRAPPPLVLSVHTSVVFIRLSASVRTPKPTPPITTLRWALLNDSAAFRCRLRRTSRLRTRGGRIESSRPFKSRSAGPLALMQRIQGGGTSRTVIRASLKAQVRHFRKRYQGILDRVMTSRVPNACAKGVGPVHVPRWVLFSSNHARAR
jgi:hypothetical protein